MHKSDIVLDRHSKWCLKSTSEDVEVIASVSQRKSNVAANAPASWATMKAGVSTGRMPAKVLEKGRASVTAGLAKDVEAVNQ